MNDILRTQEVDAGSFIERRAREREIERKRERGTKEDFLEYLRGVGGQPVKDGYLLENLLISAHFSTEGTVRYEVFDKNQAGKRIEIAAIDNIPEFIERIKYLREKYGKNADRQDERYYPTVISDGPSDLDHDITMIDY